MFSRLWRKRHRFQWSHYVAALPVVLRPEHEMCVEHSRSGRTLFEPALDQLGPAVGRQWQLLHRRLRTDSRAKRH